jgi:hypothetical protein
MVEQSTRASQRYPSHQSWQHETVRSCPSTARQLIPAQHPSRGPASLHAVNSQWRSALGFALWPALRGCASRNLAASLMTHPSCQRPAKTGQPIVVVLLRYSASLGCYNLTPHTTPATTSASLHARIGRNWRTRISTSTTMLAAYLVSSLEVAECFRPLAEYQTLPRPVGAMRGEASRGSAEEGKII